MKKLFSLFSLVLLSTSLFAYDFEAGDIYYNILSGNSVEVDSYYDNSYSGSITIPATVSYSNTTYRVIAIGSYAFAAYSNLTTVSIPNSVTTIGSSAFSGCSSLTSITIPSSVTTIGSSAFSGCSSLTQTNYTGDLASWCKIQFGTYSAEGESSYWINDGANPIEYSRNLYINGQSLTKADIPEGVTSISQYAFYGLTALTEITIPNSVTTIGQDAFASCSNLTKVTIGNSVTTIGYEVFANCSSLTAITIPNSVTTIGYGTFANCSSLTTITIPNSVTTIDSEAFLYCSSLTSVTIGKGLDSLAAFAFYGCNKLTKFICNSTHAVEAMEDDYKSDEFIGAEAQQGAFLLCNKQLDTIVAPAQLFDLKEPAWSNLTKSAKYIQVNGGELTTDAFGVINRSFDKLQTLDILAATNTEIANNAFKGCYKLETLLLPAQLERIGYMAVADCKNLQAIDIPATVTDIDDSAFENCRSIETLTFGGQQPANAPAFEETHHRRVSTASTSALQRIGNWAFYNCHELQQLEIPEGVTEVGAAAFYGCTYLEDLTLPASVQYIGDNCFALCSKLKEITCLATVPPTIEAKTFYDVNRAIPLYVPETSINDYANDTYWGEFINPQAAESDGTTNISSITSNKNATTRKVLENGTIYILREGEKYTIDGRKVE